MDLSVGRPLHDVFQPVLAKLSNCHHFSLFSPCSLMASKESQEGQTALNNREQACSTCVSFRFFAEFVCLERQGGCGKTG